MAVSNGQYLKGFYDATKNMGAKVINSDFTFEIDGFEENYLLCKQVPWPELSSGGEIEVVGPLGVTYWESQQIKTAQQGQIAFYETVAGSVDNMMTNLLANRGYFNARIYEGTPTKFLKAKRIENCFMQLDNPDRDWENRTQTLMYTGTLFFHYFGEILPGNVGEY